MMLFPPREATTTAEPPEPFGSFVINVLFNQNILQAVVGPAAKHFGLFSVFCGLFISVY